MKVDHSKNGNLTISSNPIVWLILCASLLLVNFTAMIHVMLTTPRTSWGANIIVQGPLLLLLGAPLCYAFSRKNKFKFYADKKVMEYVIQSFRFEKKGCIPVTDISEIVIQTGGSTDSGEPMERLALVCGAETIPMSVHYTNVTDFESIKNEIDVWLSKIMFPNSFCQLYNKCYLMIQFIV